MISISQHWIVNASDRLALVLFDLPDAKPLSNQVFVFLHAWSNWKDERDYAHVKIARKIVDNGTGSCVLFDYRGHGESTGSLADASFDSIVEDIDCVIKWLENKQVKKINLVCSGLGARFALSFAHLMSIDSLFLLSPAILIPSSLSAIETSNLQAVSDLLEKDLNHDHANLRKAFYKIGALPDHLSAEYIDPSFFHHPQFLSENLPDIASLNKRVVVFYDPEQDSQKSLSWLGSHTTLIPLVGGGPMFRHPDLLVQIGEKICKCCEMKS